MKRIKLLFLGLSFIIGGRLLHTDKAVAQEHAKVQEDFAKPYSPQADAQKDINELLQRAKKEHKNIIIQAGGELVCLVLEIQ